MYSYMAFVTRVIDGDTFEARVELGFGVAIEQTFRLFGIDTPETHRPRTRAEAEHGRQATKFVKDYMELQWVIISTIKDRTGKYGRYLAGVQKEGHPSLAKALRLHGFEKRDNYEDN